MTRTNRTWLVALATAAIVVAASASQGAYFSQSWGWVGLAFLVPTTLALILGLAETPGRLRTAFAVLVGGLGLWIALSATWSLSSAASVREVERMVVYVSLALAIALVLRRGDASGVLAGVFVGVVVISCYALATRLFPDWLEPEDDPFSSYRLSEPVGYWNSLGLLAAMGVLVGGGVVAHARRTTLRVAAGAAIPLLSLTLYFTFSRGAWAALAIGAATMVAADPRRLELLFATLTIAPAAVVAVAVASRQDALTTEDPRNTVADAVAQGHHVAVWLAVLAGGSAILAGGVGLVSRRVVPSQIAVFAANAALASSLVVLVIAGLLALGGPRQALSELWERFEAPYSVRDPTDLNARLFVLSSNGRTESLGVAWDAARERPLLGHGAGSYEYLWYEGRPSGMVIRDAHSLYAEMLAEVGVVGLALLALAVLVPLLAAARARRHRLVPAATGAYSAWVAHSAMDWHWEIVGVTMTALLAATVGLLAAERGTRGPLPGVARMPLLAAVAGLTLFALVSLVGNQALFAGREAVARDDYTAAVEHGRRARDLLPWSHEPAVVLGDAAAGLGDRTGAVTAYREAVEADPRNWVVWLRLAQVARGDERQRAYARVRELNPLEDELPGELGERS